ncbi:hypothetical protein [Treponema sp.]|uniref:phage tail protein n=1 Tax=Treponema sp. TaxID=166 RepID=UPI00388FB764
MNVFELAAKIGLDASGFEQALEGSRDKFSSFGDKIKSGLSNVGNITMGAVSAVGNAISGMTQSMVSSTSELANYGDSIDKASQKLGISAQAYQEWEAVMQHSGTSMEGMTATFKTLANASQGATAEQAKAFEKLGISLEDAKNMATEDLFKNVITSLQGMEEGAERTAIANDLLGRGAMEMGALLNTSAEDTQAMIDTVNQLGGVMSDEAVKASAAFNDSLQDMNTALDGVKRGITAEFLPGLTQLMDGFTALMSGSEDADEKIAEGFMSLTDGIENNVYKIEEMLETIAPSMITTLVDLLPKLSDMAAGLIEAIAESLLGHLPEILKIAVNLVKKLSEKLTQSAPVLVETVGELIAAVVSGVSDFLPELLTAGTDIVLGLIDGIIDQLPELMAAATTIMLTIVDKLTGSDNQSKLVDASIALIFALSDGLITALPQLLEKAPEIVQRLINAIVINAPKLLEAAWELLKSLVQGVKDNLSLISESGQSILLSFIYGVEALFTKLESLGTEIVETVKEGVTAVIGKAKEWGKDLIDNFIGGIKEKTEKLKESVSGIAQTVKDFLGFSEPEKGPLSDFHTFAPDMIDLFADGMKKSEGKLRNQLEDTANVIGDGFVSEAPQNKAYGVVSGGNIINITVMTDVISNDYDARRAGRMMSETLADMQVMENLSRGA